MLTSCIHFDNVLFLIILIKQVANDLEKKNSTQISGEDKPNKRLCGIT